MSWNIDAHYMLHNKSFLNYAPINYLWSFLGFWYNESLAKWIIGALDND